LHQNQENKSENTFDLDENCRFVEENRFFVYQIKKIIMLTEKKKFKREVLKNVIFLRNIIANVDEEN
jgi:hypothetical protein